jgi:DNA (cytosine-5)-methyltransferase 1
MHHYRATPQIRMRLDELVIDSFAGGGGASTGIEAAIGRPVDIAINHDADAIAMHTVNHPSTHHYCEDVFHVNPYEATQGRPVGLAWFSPDCKHFSKAKGGTPVEKKIRGLAWVALRWAATVRPRIIILENVEEFQEWGPVVNGRPDPARKGETFNLFVNKRLRRIGYAVEYRTLRACDYGTPTIRKRFFLIARCDDQPITWPQPTHGDPSTPGFRKSGLKRWRTAAEVIDWSIPCPSIFGRARPLKENTLKRIHRGIYRYVINNQRPFIVPVTHTGDNRVHGIDAPLPTITCAKGGEFALVTPHVTVFRGGATGSAADEPLPTVTANSYIKRPGGAAPLGLVTAFLAKHFGGNYTGPGASLEHPLPTVTSTDHNALVKAFLIKYYGNEKDGVSLVEPMHTIPCHDRFGLVTVHGQPYQIVDIGMRMLEPHELFAAQGFPTDYVINVDASGNSVPKYKQVARCGNSVCPPLAEALVRANYSVLQHSTKAA